MNILNEDIRSKIDALLPLYPNKQAVTLPALHLVQDALRCVPLEAVREIADMLNLAPSEVYDTMTFYGFFREDHNKLGQTRLWVCRSLACNLRGADDLLVYFSEKLGVPPGGRTTDGKITLEFAECIGACDDAPCILVNDTREGPLRPDSADRFLQWLDQLRGSEVASIKLVEAVRRKGRAISFAVEGSDERRNLQACGANALNLVDLIILQEDARKIEVLEEFLHGTQERLGLLRRFNAVEAEIHVKEFMLRHRRILGISVEDDRILRVMLKGYVDARDVSYVD